MLRLYADPDRLAARLPALRLLARPLDEIRALGRAAASCRRSARCADIAEVALVETRSQIGSGALPVSLLPSAALALQPCGPRSGERGRGAGARACGACRSRLSAASKRAASSSICAVSKTRAAFLDRAAPSLAITRRG